MYIQNQEELTEEQKALLKEISEHFSPEDSAADMSILYEVTGLQTESENFQFWENYKDFEELGEGKLVREDKDEHAMTNRNANKKKINFEDVDKGTWRIKVSRLIVSSAKEFLVLLLFLHIYFTQNEFI